MDSSNPALRVLLGFDGPCSGQAMTIKGAVGKAGILFGAVMLAAAGAWIHLLDRSAVEAAMCAAISTGITAMLGFATMLHPEWARVTALPYAIGKGISLGAISMYVESRYPGVVINAVLLTLGVFAAMLYLHVRRIIVVTPSFRVIVTAAMVGILFAYLAGIFGALTLIHETGPVGIGFCLFIVVVAAFNLSLDFDAIEYAAAAEAPKYMEWFTAFGLILSLVWLYLSSLRLVRRLRDFY